MFFVLFVNRTNTNVHISKESIFCVSQDLIHQILFIYEGFPNCKLSSMTQLSIDKQLFHILFSNHQILNMNCICVVLELRYGLRKNIFSFQLKNVSLLVLSKRKCLATSHNQKIIVCTLTDEEYRYQLFLQIS